MLDCCPFSRVDVTRLGRGLVPLVSSAIQVVAVVRSTALLVASKIWTELGRPFCHPDVLKFVTTFLAGECEVDAVLGSVTATDVGLLLVPVTA